MGGPMERLNAERKASTAHMRLQIQSDIWDFRNALKCPDRIPRPTDTYRLASQFTCLVRTSHTP